jgi:Histone deacetylase domain
MFCLKTDAVLHQMIHSVYLLFVLLCATCSAYRWCFHLTAVHFSHSKQGIARVCVVDFDVHHGNGTEDLLCRVYDPAFFYASVHAYGFAVRFKHCYTAVTLCVTDDSCAVCECLLSNATRHSLLQSVPVVYCTVQHREVPLTHSVVHDLCTPSVSGPDCLNYWMYVHLCTLSLCSLHLYTASLYVYVH